jgi:hypothetical protein
LKFIEPLETLESVPKNENAPPFTNTFQATGNRAIHRGKAFMLHGGEIA